MLVTMELGMNTSLVVVLQHIILTMKMRNTSGILILRLGRNREELMFQTEKEDGRVMLIQTKRQKHIINGAIVVMRYTCQAQMARW